MRHKDLRCEFFRFSGTTAVHPWRKKRGRWNKKQKEGETEAANYAQGYCKSGCFLRVWEVRLSEVGSRRRKSRREGRRPSSRQPKWVLEQSEVAPKFGFFYRRRRYRRRAKSLQGGLLYMQMRDGCRENRGGGLRGLTAFSHAPAATSVISQEPTLHPLRLPLGSSERL